MPSVLLAEPIGEDLKLWDPATFWIDLERACEDTGQDIQLELENVVSTWDFPPTFETTVDVGIQNAIVDVGTEDDVFRFVDKGTSIRHALMTEDFDPKSRPGSLEARPGQGSLKAVSWKINQPGIEARGFTRLLQEKYAPIFQERIAEVVARATRQPGVRGFLRRLFRH